MISSLIRSARTVGKRVGASWTIATAAFATILLSVILLAAGPIYADSVTISALRQSVEQAPPSETTLNATLSVFPEFYDDADGVTRPAMHQRLDATGADVFAQIEAEAFELPGKPDDETTRLASFQYLEGLDERSSLVDGRWPRTDSEVVETAVNAPSAEELGLEVGDTFTVLSRRNPTVQVDALVVGTFSVSAPSDPFWLGDELAATGVRDTGAFRTLGPFATSLQAALGPLAPGRIEASWRALPDYGELAVSEVGELRDSVAGMAADLDLALSAQIDTTTAGASSFTVRTGLADLMSDAERSLTVTASSVIALLIQLAILAGYALALTASLVADTRRAETALLRSRGAGPRRITTMALLEGVALTVPAVLLGPPLASSLLRLLNSFGPLADIELTIDPGPTSESYLLAALAAALALVTLAWPAYRSARSFGRPVRSSERSPRQDLAQTLGLDFALAALAVIAFWQLQELGPQISGEIRGRFGVDPLLIIAPALGLAAGALLALRLVPLLARLADRVASSIRTAVGALAAWQVARRPIRYARASLLLIIAVGIGFFAATFSTTWIASQQDQAAHSVGADLAVEPDRRPEGLSDLQLPGAYESIEGVATSMPVSSRRGRLPGELGLGRFVILDAAQAGEVVTVRKDLAPAFGQLMNQLVDARPKVATLALPGEPTSIRLEIEATEEVPEEEPEREVGFDARMRLVVQDGNGIHHRLTGMPIPVNDGPATLTFEVAGDEPAGPVYPLGIVNFEIESQMPADTTRDVNLDLRRLSVVQPGGHRVEVPFTGTDERLAADVSNVRGSVPAPSVAFAPSEAQDGLAIRLVTGMRPFEGGPAYFSIRPAGTELPSVFPIVVTEGFVQPDFASLGDQLRLASLRSVNALAEITGTVEALPGMGAATEELVLIDLPTYQALSYQPGLRFDPVDAFWLSTRGDDSYIVDALGRPPFDSFRVSSTAATTSSLLADPVALGTIGALAIGFASAVVFAAVGFAVSATVSARERIVEFALLRALGLSPRQLSSWLLIEQGVLLILSLAFGTLVGWALTAGILPLISLTQDGSPAVPVAIVEYPWETIAWMEFGMLALLAVIVASLTLILRRIGMGSLLRLGGD